MITDSRIRSPRLTRSTGGEDASSVPKRQNVCTRFLTRSAGEGDASSGLRGREVALPASDAFARGAEGKAGDLSQGAFKTNYRLDVIQA